MVPCRPPSGLAAASSSSSESESEPESESSSFFVSAAVATAGADAGAGAFGGIGVEAVGGGLGKPMPSPATGSLLKVWTDIGRTPSSGLLCEAMVTEDWDMMRGAAKVKGLTSAGAGEVCHAGPVPVLGTWPILRMDMIG